MFSFLDKFFRWRRAREVIKYLPENAIVCDIGCGREAYFLKNISPFIKKGVGLDEEAKNENRDNLEIKKFRISNSLPLASETYDAVTMLAVLEHLENPKEAIKESFRLLKKGGKFILTTPTSAAKPILEFLAFKLNIIDRGEIKDHKNYFTNEEIKEMLASAGFAEYKNHYFECFLNNLVVAKK